MGAQKVVVGNYWGRNFGDDAMLAGLAMEEPGFVRLSVVCQRLPFAGSKVLSMASCEPIRSDALAIWRAIGASEALIMGGGTHLEFRPERAKLPQYRVLLMWLAVACAVRMRRRKFELRSIGIGPLDGPLPRLIAKSIVRLASETSVRDAASSACLTQWGRRHRVVPDLAVRYFKSVIDASPPATTTPKSDPGYVLAAPAFVSFSPTWWRDAILREMSITGSEGVVLLATCRQAAGDDNDAVAIIRQVLGDELPSSAIRVVQYDGDVDAATALIRSARSVVAARYHVVLAAKYFNTRVVPDFYHPKVRAAMQMPDSWGLNQGTKSSSEGA